MFSKIIIVYFKNLLNLLCNPVHAILLSLSVYLAYTLVKNRTENEECEGNGANIALMELDMPYINKNLTMRQLRNFDGYQPDARILVAMNGYIFDVSRARAAYGPGGIWAQFAGRDMTRCLARPGDFEYIDPQLEFDDLSDLSYKEMQAVGNWERTFRLEFPLVGKVLRDGVQQNGSEGSWENTYVEDGDEELRYDYQWHM